MSGIGRQGERRYPLVLHCHSVFALKNHSFGQFGTKALTWGNRVIDFFILVIFAVRIFDIGSIFANVNQKVRVPIDRNVLFLFLCR